MKILPLILAILALEATAFAQPSPEDLYAEGQAAYDHADYQTAISKWQEAYALSKENGLLFNIGQAKRLASDCSGALAAYRLFLATSADLASEQHRLATDLERELEGQCGAAPNVDPPRLEPQPKETPVSAGTERADDRERGRAPGRTLKITGIVTGAAGIGALATGIYLGHRAQSIGDEVTDACRTSCDWADYKDKDAQGKRYASIGRGLVVGGVVGVAGGAVLYYLGVRQAAAVTITPRAREGLTISWSAAW